MGTDVTNPATLGDLPPLLASLFFWLLIFSGSVAIIIIILSGIRFILSGGEAKTVETAKKSMTYAIIGLLLVFFSFFILNLIGTVTGVNCLTAMSRGQIGFTMCQSASSPTDLPSAGY
jgi:hypothetical protein